MRFLLVILGLASTTAIAVEPVRFFCYSYPNTPYTRVFTNLPCHGQIRIANHSYSCSELTPSGAYHLRDSYKCEERSWANASYSTPLPKHAGLAYKLSTEMTTSPYRDGRTFTVLYDLMENVLYMTDLSGLTHPPRFVTQVYEQCIYNPSETHEELVARFGTSCN